MGPSKKIQRRESLQVINSAYLPYTYEAFSGQMNGAKNTSNTQQQATLINTSLEQLYNNTMPLNKK